MAPGSCMPTHIMTWTRLVFACQVLLNGDQPSAVPVWAYRMP